MKGSGKVDTMFPMFTLMGQLAFDVGFTRELFAFTRAWLGRLPGGHALGVIAGCTIFAACSGSSVATAAAMGKISIPEMTRAGYDKRIAAGSVASGGTLGIMIPPSIFLVLYGVMTGTSIGKLLIAGVIPGLLSAFMFMGSVMIRASINPNLAPLVPVMTWKETHFKNQRHLGNPRHCHDCPRTHLRGSLHSHGSCSHRRTRRDVSWERCPGG